MTQHTTFNAIPTNAIKAEALTSMSASFERFCLAAGLEVRIPTIVTTRSDVSRPPVPIDRDQRDGAVRCIF